MIVSELIWERGLQGKGELRKQLSLESSYPSSWGGTAPQCVTLAVESWRGREEALQVWKNFTLSFSFRPERPKTFCGTSVDGLSCKSPIHK